MKKFKIAGLVLIVGLKASCALCGQSFFDARAAALSGATAAWDPGVSALYGNPATLGQLRQSELSASYGFLNPSPPDGAQVLDDESLGGAVPFNKLGNVALAWRTFSQSQRYHEQLLSFGIAQEVSKRWSFGLAMHYVSRTLETHIAELEELRSPFTVNLGGVYRVTPFWQTGISYDGVVPSARGALIQQPGTLRWAMAYQWKSVVGLTQLNVVPSPASTGRDLEYLVAAEKWTISSDFSKADWALRCGFLARSDEQMQWSAGGAFRRKNVELSYAIFAPFHDLEKSQASHQLSLIYRFGKLQPATEWKVAAPKVGLQNLVEFANPNRSETQGGSRQDQLSLRIKKALRQIRYYQKQLRMQKGQVSQVSYQLSHPGFQKLDDIYAELLDRYWQLKDQGIPMRLRQEYLTTLVETLKEKKVAVEKAQKELDQVQTQWNQVEQSLAQDWSAYTQALVNRPGPFERLEKLEQLIAAYGKSGVDLFHVENELANLK